MGDGSWGLPGKDRDFLHDFGADYGTGVAFFGADLFCCRSNAIIRLAIQNANGSRSGEVIMSLMATGPKFRHGPTRAR